MSRQPPSPAPPPAPAIPPRSRLAATLGAAVALLCAAIVGFDMPSGLAQGDFFESLFGGGYRYVVAPLYYGKHYAPSRVRHARRHARRHMAQRIAHWPAKNRYAHLRRRVAAVRRLAPVEAARPVSAPARLAAAATPVRTVTLADQAAKAAPATMNRRSVCVRVCDGYFFPIAKLSSSAEIGTHQATCNKLCPGAETKLFVMQAGSDRIEDAEAARGGGAYAALKARIDANDENTKTCSCNATTSDPTNSAAYLRDFTLRPGDTVVTPQGMRIVRSGSHFPFKSSDFLSLAETRDVPQATRGALAAIERAMKTPHGRARVETTAAGQEKAERHRRRQRELRSEAAPGVPEHGRGAAN